MMIGEPIPIKVVITNSKRTISGSIPDQFASPAQTPKIFLLALSSTKRAIFLTPYDFQSNRLALYCANLYRGLANSDFVPSAGSSNQVRNWRNCRSDAHADGDECAKYCGKYRCDLSARCSSHFKFLHFLAGSFRLYKRYSRERASFLKFNINSNID